MKKLLLGLLLVLSSSSFAKTQISSLALLSAKYDLRTVVENTFGSEIEEMDYSEDGESLNVYHDSRVCHNISFKELDLIEKKVLVVADIKRDVTCDK